MVADRLRAIPRGPRGRTRSSARLALLRLLRLLGPHQRRPGRQDSRDRRAREGNPPTLDGHHAADRRHTRFRSRSSRIRATPALLIISAFIIGPMYYKV